MFKKDVKEIYFSVSMSTLIDFVLIFDVRVLGTAGQNVNDIFKVSTFEDRLEILEHTMKWSHIAPTAPDTLGKLYCIGLRTPDW